MFEIESVVMVVPPAKRNSRKGRRQARLFAIFFAMCMCRGASVLGDADKPS